LACGLGLGKSVVGSHLPLPPRSRLLFPRGFFHTTASSPASRPIAQVQLQLQHPPCSPTPACARRLLGVPRARWSSAPASPHFATVGTLAGTTWWSACASTSRSTTHRSCLDLFDAASTVPSPRTSPRSCSCCAPIASIADRRHGQPSAAVANNRHASTLWGPAPAACARQRPSAACAPAEDVLAVSRPAD